VELYDHATNDCWCRDHGPIFVRDRHTGEVAATDWRYNAWGGKYRPYTLDNQISYEDLPGARLRRFAVPMVLEGGSIDVNGAGGLLTTESCLLNRNRNPRLTREQIEQTLRENSELRSFFGWGPALPVMIPTAIVDDLSRFFRADGIVTAMERNRRDVKPPAIARESGTAAGSAHSDRSPIYARRAAHAGTMLPARTEDAGQLCEFPRINGAVLVPISTAETRNGRDPGRLFFSGREDHRRSTVSTWSGGSARCTASPNSSLPGGGMEEMLGSWKRCLRL